MGFLFCSIFSKYKLKGELGERRRAELGKNSVYFHFINLSPRFGAIDSEGAIASLLFSNHLPPRCCFCT
ncbi:hypothetical protein KFK09_010808 [Dendrobium nobile]|uniref:Uncharacterized protein n=1 Tax=Dendrobium nobile TaxID=94219 RepID=A0A8T3BD44_DENNO|nr:hypothetical protein KFK09_010808 [Dendrobium nobile]